MQNIDRRLAALEAARMRSDGRLVLLAPRGLLTEAQHAKVDAAAHDGREILVIETVAPVILNGGSAPSADRAP